MAVKGGRLRSPIVWFGGKGGMLAKLLPLIPSHTTYVEPFGGGASLLLAHEPSAVEVYNDLNRGLVNFFRVLRDPDRFGEFQRLAQLTPYAREEFDLCRKSWSEAADPVERAHRWFLVARMSFAGSFGNGWSFAVTKSSRGMAARVSAWLSVVEMLPALSERLLRVQVEQKDALDVIATYDSEGTFFYLDPPYVHSTRRSGGYEHELDDEQHRRLVRLLLSVKGKVLLSGYASAIYSELEENGWRRKDWKVVCHTGGDRKSKQQRVESVWFNYEIEDGGELALAP